jgi:hypothetical protein
VPQAVVGKISSLRAFSHKKQVDLLFIVYAHNIHQ